MTTPTELLQTLIRFDTTNPPGNETVLVSWVRNLLEAAGIECQVYAKTPERANLVARLKGRGLAPPLLLQGHVDVVTTAGQDWTYPPFSGEIHDGYLWGRGALDMKGGVAMMIAALLHAHQDGFTPPGDVILTLLADEEAGSQFGAGYLIQEYAEIFEGVRFALGEFGGFTLNLLGKRYYPIMVAEKQYCEVLITIKGPGGHAALAHREGTMARLGKILVNLNHTRLPIHVTPAVRLMVEGMAEPMSFPVRLIMKQLLNPMLSNHLLGLLGDASHAFEALLRNSVNATIVRGGEKENVIPSEITLKMDGRLLPGFTPDDLLTELRPVIGDDVDIEIAYFNPGPAGPDMALFPVLADILKEQDSNGFPVPLVIPHVTDAAQFSRLGIQTYGFLPMQLPEDFKFLDAMHAVDERIPVEALEFGTHSIHQVIQRFGEIST